MPLISAAIRQSIPTRRQLFWTVAAGLVGLGLSFLDLPILPNVMLVYTGVCYLLIALSFGPACGALCAAIGMPRTVFLFGDGYSLLLAVMESIAIACLTRRRHSALAAALIFWALIGLPFLWLMVFHLLHLPIEPGWAVILKRIVNGLVNVIVADFLLMGPGLLRMLRGREAAPNSRSLSQILSGVFLLATIVPIFFLSIMQGRAFAQHEERETVERLRESARAARKNIDEYLAKHLEAITSMGQAIEAQDRMEPAALRAQLRQQNEIYRGFLTMLVADEQGKILAANIRGEERPAANISASINDRDYFRQPMQSGKPYISDVFLGRGLGHDPIVAVSAPIRDPAGKIRGLIEGSLDLRRFQRFEQSPAPLEEAEYAIVDQHDRVIYASTSLHYAVLSQVPPGLLPAVRERATTVLVSPNGKGRPSQPQPFVSSSTTNLTGWRVVAQQSTLPLERELEAYYLHTLAWLLFAAAATIALASRVARHVTRPLQSLVGALRNFDVNTSAGRHLSLSPYAPREFAGIQMHFQELSARLGESHTAMVRTLAEKEELNQRLQSVLADLDRKVQVRTEELAEARVRAETASQTKSLFLANMSHEIRTPLNAVLGYSQLMLRDPDLTAGSRRSVNIINSSGEHLLALLNDILDMSRIEAGRATLDPSAFDIVRLVGDLSDMFRLRASAKKLDFALVEEGELARWLLADQGKIRQVLINLLGNAVKFTETGGVTLRVSTPIRQERLWLSVAVEDTGVGIAEVELAQLFRPFAQARNAANTEGTGLGLAISMEFAHLMGGKLTASSTVGKGTTFRFEVPVTHAVRDSDPEMQSAAVHRLHPGEERRVLVVDDDANSREWLRDFLASVGFVVCEAENGVEAVQVANESRPHLIVMDVRMPEMNGFDATRAIRTLEGRERPVIIALSASALDEDRRAALDAGLDDFIVKPCRAQELLEKIACHLDVRYRYGDPTPRSDADWTAAPDERSARLESLPVGLMDELHQATLNGEKDRMDEIISKLRLADQSVAETLQKLADGYEYDSLLALCTGARRN
jgi:signal transduction histidine kinase/DNA-binding response OmpR family regulator